MKQTEQELATELELLDAQIERLAAEVKNLRAIRRKLKAKMDPTRLQSRCEVNDFNIPTIEEYKNMNKAEKGKY